MEESVSLNNEAGSILLREYNDLLREVHHLGETQMFNGISEQMRHSIDENKLLTDDQAILLQCELNSIKVELEKNQLLQHVCREMDQRSIKSDSAIIELENVIHRKETIVETMRKVLTQTMQLYNGRNKMLEGMQSRNEDLKLQLAQADSRIRNLTDQLRNTAAPNDNENKYSSDDIVSTIEKSLKKAFQNDIRFELKSFSDSLIYFVMYIGAVATNDPQLSNIPLKCVLTKDDDGSFKIKYLFFGSQQQPLDVEKLQSTPFPIPMLIDLIHRYQHNNK